MAASLRAACVPATFGGLGLFGAEVLSIEAALVTNYTASSRDFARGTQPSTELDNATFCNVTVSYTHPGQEDNILVETWLPIENPTWNDRLQASGGAGWVAGRQAFSYETMAGSLADGYAATTTDAGLGSTVDPAIWAVTSPGNINWYSVNNFASVALNDQAIISKDVVESFYGKAAAYSYFNGCSQGGRQGLMLAQRYPTAYDGIAAGAPAMYLSRTGPSLYWPQEVMNMLNRYPYGCEMEAIAASAISECDGLDGVVDGIISDPDACLALFNPSKLIGTPVPNCRQAGNETVEISTAATVIVNATWHGVITANGAWTWHGVGPGADISNEGLVEFEIMGTAATNCDSGVCVGRPNQLGVDMMQSFLGKGDPNLDISKLTYSQFDDMIHYGRQIYGSFDTNDPDLSRFRNAGGKLISWHGLVTALLSDTPDFYRHYELPGLGHCIGRASGQPTSLFDQLRAWVENGTAPEHTPVDVTVLDGSLQHRIACPYPEVAKFEKDGCEDPADAGCWSCVAP
ncbi:tannase and feruloyl esterase-domain-containing protein [Chaetomium fimeti]|uniref:Carboxylic ester hydrolase n=1 Tax=Chaetomium fimeti TaxID=1854472 RepID=A0AAE0HA83_9PEZI|nr:tannase and feruloyl esterase-domain-containing protein [Chaetomium fimeti]